MKQSKRVPCCLSLMLLSGIQASYAAMIPPDSIVVYHQKVTIACNKYLLSAERVTTWKNYDTVVALAISGKDVTTGFDKFTLATNKGEKYIIHLPNANTVYINSVSSLAFNPQAANFFDIVNGEVFIDVKQNSKIYITPKLFVWALSGASLNVRHYDASPTHAELCLLHGQAKAAMEQNAQVLDAGKMYAYVNADLKGIDTDTSDVKAWVIESFNYRSIPYNYLVKRITDWYRKDVIFLDKIPESHISFNGLFSEPLAVVISRLNEKRKKTQCHIEADKLIVE